MYMCMYPAHQKKKKNWNDCRQKDFSQKLSLYVYTRIHTPYITWYIFKKDLGLHVANQKKKIYLENGDEHIASCLLVLNENINLRESKTRIEKKKRTRLNTLPANEIHGACVSKTGEIFFFLETELKQKKRENKKEQN